MPSKPEPTDQQRIALEQFRGGKTLKVSAFAGTGKTTTLSLFAKSRDTKKGLYLAYNRSIARDARDKFPQSVECCTTHKMAWRAIQSSHCFTNEKMKDKLFPKQLSEELELKEQVFFSKMSLDGTQQSSLVLQTIKHFCESADNEIAAGHIPRIGRLRCVPELERQELDKWILLTATTVWMRMTSPSDAMPLGHDGYLKLWALGRPQFACDFIMLDEAQDTNAVVLDVLSKQKVQIVYVGDKHQQIYEWRGAINAMEKITDCEEAFLTQSFRFGQEIASCATKVLRTLGEQKSLLGNPARQSEIVPSGRAQTILARTNTTVISQVLECLKNNQTTCILGGTRDLEQFVADVFKLKKGSPGKSPEFFGFRDWKEVVSFSQAEEGFDLRMFVQLVHDHGEVALDKAVKSVVEDESSADVIVSTTHKAKGREWDSVRIAPDFFNSSMREEGRVSKEEARLFYVAITRARFKLIVDTETLHLFRDDADGVKNEKFSDTISPPPKTTPVVAPRPKVLPTRPLRPLSEILKPLGSNSPPGHNTRAATVLPTQALQPLSDISKTPAVTQAPKPPLEKSPQAAPHKVWVTARTNELRNNRAAVTGFWLGIASIFLNFIGILPLLGVVFSVIGLCTFDSNKHKNRWLAGWGLGINSVSMLVHELVR